MMIARIRSLVVDRWIALRFSFQHVRRHENWPYVLVTLIAIMLQSWLLLQQPRHGAEMAWPLWLLASLIPVIRFVQEPSGLGDWLVMSIAGILIWLGAFMPALVALFVADTLYPPGISTQTKQRGFFTFLCQVLYSLCVWFVVVLPGIWSPPVFAVAALLGADLLRRIRFHNRHLFSQSETESDSRSLLETALRALLASLCLAALGAGRPWMALLGGVIAILLEITLRQLHDTSVAARSRWEQDLHVARVVQSSLNGCVPVIMPAYEAFGASYPAAAVGGDYIDLIPLDDHRCLMLLGDVMGKGLPAALLMVLLRNAVRAEVRAEQRPGPLLTAINSFLYKDFRAVGAFATLGCALIDVKEGLVVFATAGQGPLIHVPVQGEAVELRSKGPPLGLRLAIRYEETTAPIAINDLLFLASDGMIDATGRDGARYGRERVRSVLMGNRLLPLLALPELLAQDVLRFATGNSRDDLSLACLRIRKLMTQQ